MIKVAFLGTPKIGARALESLIENTKIEVVVVVTVPDKAVGRSHSVLQSSPVARIAKEHNIQTIKTNSINKDFLKLKLFDFDYLLTCAFGQILSRDVLSLPGRKALNVHGSLLPEGRGGAPLHWAIINGKRETGISIMEMVEEMDAGNFYFQYKMDITDNDTVSALFDKMGDLIYEKTAMSLLEIQNGKDFTKQDESKVTFWKNIKKEDAKIDFNKPMKEVYNFIRGLEKIPGARTTLNGKVVKIHKTTLLQNVDDTSRDPGTITNISDEGISVQTKKGIINISELTFEGGKRSKVSELVNGKSFKRYDKFE